MNDTQRLTRRSGQYKSTLVQQRDGDRLASLRRRDHLHAHALSLAEGGQSRTLNDSNVHEHVLAAVVANDETEALVPFEPLDRSLDDSCRRWIRALSAGLTAAMKSALAAVPERQYSRPPRGPQ